MLKAMFGKAVRGVALAGAVFGATVGCAHADDDFTREQLQGMSVSQFDKEAAAGLGEINKLEDGHGGVCGAERTTIAKQIISVEAARGAMDTLDGTGLGTTDQARNTVRKAVANCAAKRNGPA